MAFGTFLFGVALINLLSFEGAHAGFRWKCGKMPKSGHMPWLAVIAVNGDPCCFGSLISPDFVLTDGHCGFGPESNVRISLGNMVTAGHGDNCQEMRSVEYFKCNEPTAKSHLIKDGICLLKLSSPVNFTEYVYPICLPESSEYPFPTEMPSYLTTGTSPGDLVKVPIVGYNQCKCSYPTLNQYQICAGQGYGPPRLNRCLDNLGAGVVTRIDGRMTLVGVVSVDQSCTDHGYLRPFTAVAPFYSFIQGVACDVPPVFVPFYPTGNDPDTNFVCSAPGHPEPGLPVDDKEGFEDVFTDGVAGMHLSPFIFLCVLVLSLFIAH
ncbi:chymotrypsinogen B-like [Cheilinus undulatus]|uniref:chymotrypsinogen B-like n=1 Tax=Cheilinus undulatus TaxID=241271 RepID=UPI001BD46653|nr:chymotrypsinogen B-like [Cheilinus undulatus]